MQALRHHAQNESLVEHLVSADTAAFMTAEAWNWRPFVIIATFRVDRLGSHFATAVAALPGSPCFALLRRGNSIHANK
jgi:hypothetical protein